jgi:hypothetical protein
MTGWGTLSLAIIALLAAGGTLLGILQARRSRHAETFANVSQRWNEALFREARRKIRDYHGAGGSVGLMKIMLELSEKYDSEFWELLIALDYFEDLAMLVKYRAITFKMVDNYLGTTVCKYWSMFRPFVIQQRFYEGHPDYTPGYIEEFEKLAYKVSKKHHYKIPWEFPKITNKAASSAAVPAHAQEDSVAQQLANLAAILKSYQNEHGGVWTYPVAADDERKHRAAARRP